MKPVRAFLFVPGNRGSMLENAAGAGADALILDLEDSVPTGRKFGARARCQQDCGAIEEGAARLGAHQQVCISQQSRRPVGNRPPRP